MTEFYLLRATPTPRSARWLAWQDGSEILWYSPLGHSQVNRTQVSSAALDARGIEAEMRRELKSPALRVERRTLAYDQYHPRIWRRVIDPNGDSEPKDFVERTGLRDALESSLASAELLFEDLQRVFRVVEPVSSHGLVYGHELRQLLVLACTEVESAWRAVLAANLAQPSQNARFTTQDYVKLLSPMHLADWTVELTRTPERMRLTPFAHWSVAQPTQTLPWYDAYNRTKHDRETNLADANLKAVIDALAALVIMLAAQFGPPAISGRTGGFQVFAQPSWTDVELYAEGFTLCANWTDVPLGL